ncbi:MAG: ABC transporter ATP-binding protein [Wenzhouxiangellaceae bacterium]|nr:ABC transporter ATP-binding protein [Wenzhouxiangellaceae bacterium]
MNARAGNETSTTMLVALARRYPGRTLTVLLALLLASLLDGLGLSTILSLVSLTSEVQQDTAASLAERSDPSLPEQLINSAFGLVGISPTLPWLLALGIALILVKTVVVLLANRQVGYAVAQVATDLRLDLVRAVVASRWRYYLSKPVGSLANAMATEAQRASEGYLQGAIMATQLITAVVYLALSLLLSWQVTLGTMLLAAILLGGLNRLVRKAGKAGKRQTGLLKHILSVMTDQLAAIKPLKAMGREDRFDTLIRTETEDLNRTLRKQVFAKEAMKALQEALLVILAAIGLVIMLAALDMPLAEVMVLIFLLARVITLLSKAQRAWQHMAIAESAFWSLTTAIEEAEHEHEPVRGSEQPTLTRAIRFEQVRFSHPGHAVFEQLDLDIPVGALTVITGPSGSGKTTLIDLVAGLLRPDEGRVLIDDIDLEQIDRKAWRRSIGYVPQEALLVNDTVFNNITLGAPELDQSAVESALRKADAWDFVTKLPGGMQATIGERGGQLSGGQRQRLAIARALVHRPALLILDEATSNLDQVAEQAVLSTVAHLKGELTLLAVTHQPGLLTLADRIFEVRDGQLRPRAVEV